MPRVKSAPLTCIVLLQFAFTSSCVHRLTSGDGFLPADGCYQRLTRCDEKSSTMIRTYSADGARVQVALSPLSRIVASDDDTHRCLSAVGVEKSQIATVMEAHGGGIWSGPEELLPSTLRLGQSWAAFGDRVHSERCLSKRTVEKLSG